MIWSNLSLPYPPSPPLDVQNAHGVDRINTNRISYAWKKIKSKSRIPPANLAIQLLGGTREKQMIQKSSRPPLIRRCRGRRRGLFISRISLNESRGSIFQTITCSWDAILVWDAISDRACFEESVGDCASIRVHFMSTKLASPCVHP